MLPTTIRSPPVVSDYMPLAEYQSQTPESFADGKPVLHFHLVGAKASTPKSQCGSLALFPADAVAVSGEDSSSEAVVEQTVDVFATTGSFTIFSQQAEAGVSIPYPSISIHAVKQTPAQASESNTSAVWMQLEISDGGVNDDDFQTVELTIVPAATDDAAETPSQARQLYEAIANCSNLHPDPNNQDEDDEDDVDRIIFEGSAQHEAVEGFSGVLRGATDGGMPPPMPGSGGWITADNVNDYFDADGNWINQEEEAEELGEGAGRTRDRDELEQDGVNGHVGEDDPENKRARVD